MEIPPDQREIFDENPIAHISSIRPDGRPHVTPVWIDYQDGHLLMAGRRRKQRHVNMRENPEVAVSIMNPDKPYDALLVDGVVDEITPDGALEFLDRKAREHLGVSEHPIQDEDRLLVKIRVENVIDAGADIDTD